MVIRQYCCNQKYIEAIDGTHVKVCFQGENITPYRSRKSTITHNVMYMAEFDLCFTYVYAGWKGITHDLRIFLECIHDLNSRFPMLAEGSIICTYVYVFFFFILYNTSTIKFTIQFLIIIPFFFYIYIATLCDIILFLPIFRLFLLCGLCEWMLQGLCTPTSQ